MTPAEYIKIEKSCKETIKNLEEMIHLARKQCNHYKPIYTRQATPSDIYIGSIIWHQREERYGGDYWNVVRKVLHPEDDFKAYVGDDGCRYGLSGAYIET